MKKVFLAVICTLFSSVIFAQRAATTSTSFFSTEKSDQSIVLGIRTGVNFSNMSIKYDGFSKSFSSRTAFNVGVSADIPLVESMYIQSGLYFSSKGCKDEDVKVTPMYLEIPLLASYRYNFSRSAQLQFNFGPYFGCGVGGKIKDDDSSIDFFGNDGEFKRFDAGLQIGAGMTFSKIYLGFAYQFGMANLYADDDDESCKNKNFMINVGYNF